MLETVDFFETQIKQCRDTAARSNKKNDREFWLKMANRWEGLLHARQPRNADADHVQKFSFQRLRLARLAKRRRAALASRH